MPLWVRLDYLISTWAQTPEEEQLLMGGAIKGLLEHPTISGPDLKGDSLEAGLDTPGAAVSEAGRGRAVALLGVASISP